MLNVWGVMSHLSILWTQWDKEEKGSSRTQEAETWYDWGVPISPVSRSSPVSFAPTIKFQLPSPRLPHLPTPFLPLCPIHAAKGIFVERNLACPPSCSKPSQGLVTAPDGDQAPHTHQAHSVWPLSTCPFPSSPTPVYSSVTRKVNFSPFTQSHQPFPRHGTRSHLFHFQREPVKPPSSTLFPPLALNTAAPQGKAELDESIGG